LLPGLREATRAHLEQEGIVTLDQFAALEIGEIQRIKGVKTTAAALRANARAFIHSRPIWFERLPDDLRQGGWMLDLETRSLPGEDGSVWCLGWSNESGKAHIVVVAGGREPRLLPFASGQSVWIVPHCDAAWQRFHDSVAADSKPIYHWTGFDAGVMQRTAPPHVREALLPRTHDLHRTLVNTVRLPVRSYSIKAVAHYFGFQWSGYQDWTEAELDYHRWLRLGHEPALERACGYQRDDVIALARVWQWMTAAAPEGDPSI
jgi:predicted RecB family nuclease